MHNMKLVLRMAALIIAISVLTACATPQQNGSQQFKPRVYQDVNMGYAN